MDNVRDIINGAQLPRFINKPVSVIGQVQDIDANGKFFEIKAVDDVVVKINVKEPINIPISGWVDAVLGIVEISLVYIDLIMDNVRDIINGAQLPRFINKPVSVIGQVQDIDANGKFFEIKAVDDVVVKINVKEPINIPISGWVEARGISTGRAINAEDFVIFSNEKFDAKGHNTLCKLLYSVPNIWETSSPS